MVEPATRWLERCHRQAILIAFCLCSSLALARDVAPWTDEVLSEIARDNALRASEIVAAHLPKQDKNETDAFVSAAPQLEQLLSQFEASGIDTVLEGYPSPSALCRVYVLKGRFGLAVVRFSLFERSGEWFVHNFSFKGLRADQLGSDLMQYCGMAIPSERVEIPHIAFDNEAGQGI